MTQSVIDMSQFKGRIYLGRDKGAASYLYFDLLNKEQMESHPIIISFPDDTKALISSFYLGMFGHAIRRFGSKKAFYQQYRFTGPEHILESIDEYIDIALNAS